MNDGVRRAVVAALLQLADSRDYQDRADAGQAMASFVDVTETREPLQRLLLDAADTFVSHVTAEALLRRMDAVGLEAVARALATADDSHAHWLDAAVRGVFLVYATQRDAALQMCGVMVESADPVLRKGAAELRDILTEIDPILHPAGEN
ncbi:hypothetical protein ACPB67_06265 [Micromonospora taraxaci]|uniref:hypothetical protein n=1 Tax=Micromonospora taraxaci TaxID=1316803 RepID=UPI003C2F5F9D